MAPLPGSNKVKSVLFWYKLHVEIHLYFREILKQKSDVILENMSNILKDIESNLACENNYFNHCLLIN